MLSLIVGFGTGCWVSQAKSGLVAVFLYGAVVGVISANVSYNESAAISPILLALVGWGFARVMLIARSLLRATSERYGKPDMNSPNKERAGTYEALTRNNSPEVGSDEDILVAAGIAHASYLNAHGRELSDVEFVATALGSFDGVVQAFGRKLNQVDMMAKGTTFALQQIIALERMKDASPEVVGDMIRLAMVSEDLDGLRAQSGQVAHHITRTFHP